MHHEQILAAIYRAIDILNAGLPPEKHVAKSPESRLFGRQSTVDSLGLVSLIIQTEREIEEASGVAITLADDRALSLQNSPFRSIDTLAAFIGDRLAEAAHV